MEENNTEVEYEQSSAEDAVTRDFNDDIVEVDTTGTDEQEPETTEFDFDNLSQDDLEYILQTLKDDEDMQPEKPEFELPEKFKDVNDLIKSYQMLEGKIGNFKGAPEKYEIEGIDMDDPIMSELTGVAKELNMSNDALGKLVTKYNESIELMEQSRMQEEFAALGSNAEQRISYINNFLDNNMSPHQAEAIKSLATSAEAVSAIESLIQFAKPSAPTTISSTRSAPTEADIQQMMFAKDEYGNNKMETDSAYAARVNQLMSQMWG